MTKEKIMSEETTENEIETNPLNDMIQHAIDQNYNQANNAFNDMMTIKMSDLLDQEKIKIADQIYNGAESDEEDPDEDQLELDLEDDSEDDSEEDEEESED